MLTKAFWIATLERAVKTAAQAIILGFGMSDSGFVNAFELDYKLAAGFAAGGAVLSVLTSIASSPFSGDGPSLANEVAK